MDHILKSKQMYADKTEDFIKNTLSSLTLKSKNAAEKAWTTYIKTTVNTSCELACKYMNNGNYINTKFIKKYKIKLVLKTANKQAQHEC